MIVPFAPDGVPRDRIAKLHDAAVAALADGDARRSLADRGGQIVGGPPEHLAAFLVSENRNWGELVKLANVSLN